MVFTFLENALNLCIFNHTPVPHSKHQAGFFKNLFQFKRGGENYDLLYQNLKIYQNMKMTWNIRLFVFCMIYHFYKCDGFTVL